MISVTMVFGEYYLNNLTRFMYYLCYAYVVYSYVFTFWNLLLLYNIK
jgi:hypothetical protein